MRERNTAALALVYAGQGQKISVEPNILNTPANTGCPLNTVGAGSNFYAFVAANARSRHRVFTGIRLTLPP